jgi:hypothetical protein
MHNNNVIIIFRNNAEPKITDVIIIFRNNAEPKITNVNWVAKVFGKSANLAKKNWLL